MKYYVVLCCLLAAAIADEKYSDKYDNTDIEELKKNDRLLEGYLNCLVEKGPCTPEGKNLKENLPDALETECAKCTDTQKEKAEDLIKFLIEEKPALWKQVSDKYDPEGIYKAKYDKKAHEHGIKLP